MIKRTGKSFYARGDDGKRYLVLEYRDFTEITTLHGTQRQEMPGQPFYRLESGHDVLPPSGSETIWLIRDTGVRLTPER